MRFCPNQPQSQVLYRCTYSNSSFKTQSRSSSQQGFDIALTIPNVFILFEDCCNIWQWASLTCWQQVLFRSAENGSHCFWPKESSVVSCLENWKSLVVLSQCHIIHIQSMVVPLHGYFVTVTAAPSIDPSIDFIQFTWNQGIGESSRIFETYPSP